MQWFSGLGGILTVAASIGTIFASSYRIGTGIPSYNLDPGGRPGAFEPLL
jgi:hypothetical protein